MTFRPVQVSHGLVIVSVDSAYGSWGSAGEARAMITAGGPTRYYGRIVAARNPTFTGRHRPAGRGDWVSRPERRGRPPYARRAVARSSKARVIACTVS